VFTLAAVATLALGIGSTSAIFSVARTALASPLPFPDAARRVMIFSRWTAFQKTSVADQEIWDYRAMAHTLSAVAGWTTAQENLTGRRSSRTFDRGASHGQHIRCPRRQSLARARLHYEEDRPKGPPVAILGHGLWRARFGGDPSVIGRKIVLDDVPVEVVGVMPRGFRLPTDYTDDVTEPTELWRPAQIDETRMSRSHGYNAAALLAPGQTARTASEELAAIARQLTQRGEYRETMHFTAFARTVDEEIRGPLRPAMLLLTGGVVCLLLIACANVGNLLLVRGETRQRELALRSALGASGSRLLQDLLLEAFVLAFAGAALGLPLALAGLGVVRAFDPTALEALGSLSIHWQMMLVSVGAAALTTVLFSAAPIVGHQGVLRILRETGSNATAARGRARLRRLLVMLEVAVATVLLVAAGLMVRSVEAMRRGRSRLRAGKSAHDARGAACDSIRHGGPGGRLLSPRDRRGTRTAWCGSRRRRPASSRWPQRLATGASISTASTRARGTRRATGRSSRTAPSRRWEHGCRPGAGSKGETGQTRNPLRW
jgi:putative ABC transport system permease protein